MFGHQNDQQQHDASQVPDPAASNDVGPSQSPTFTPAPSPASPTFGSQPFTPPVPDPSPTPTSSVFDLNSTQATQDVAAVSSTNDLLDIKQNALNQLSPLVGHLEQTPEEKFRTTMMMIQASDNQSLIKDAYAAAQQINDEKAKAQALLDVINEINYFTQHQDG